jgi:hypothetical protein
MLFQQPRRCANPVLVPGRAPDLQCGRRVPGILEKPRQFAHESREGQVPRRAVVAATMWTKASFCNPSTGSDTAQTAFAAEAHVVGRTAR